jgi:hypothetical protein
MKITEITKHAQKTGELKKRNPVAAAGHVNRASTHRDKTKYRRKDKHKKRDY